MDRKTIKDEAKEVLVGKRLMLLLLILIVSAISGALASIGIGFLIAPLLSMGLFLIVKDMFAGKEINVNRFVDIFKDLNHAVKVIAVSLLTGLIVFIGMVLLIIPGIIFAMQYSQASYIMAENPEMGIWEAMTASKNMMIGHKIELFIFGLSFIGHILLIILTLGLYAFYVIPYFQTSYVNYYLHLTNQKNQPKTQIVLDL